MAIRFAAPKHVLERTAIGATVKRLGIVLTVLAIKALLSCHTRNRLSMSACGRCRRDGRGWQGQAATAVVSSPTMRSIVFHLLWVLPRPRLL